MFDALVSPKPGGEVRSAIRCAVLPRRMLGAPCVDLGLRPKQRPPHLRGLRKAVEAAREGVDRLDLDAKPFRRRAGAQESFNVHSHYDKGDRLFIVTMNRGSMDTFRCGHPRSVENVAPNGGGSPICRTCRNARKRKDYAADVNGSREAARARQQRYRGGFKGNANARKETCAQGHAFDEENTYLYKGNRQCKTCRKQRVTESFERHKEKRVAEQREYYQRNREKLVAGSIQWAKDNPERAALTSRLKKQRRRAAGVFTAAEWHQIQAQYGHRCLACGSDGPLTIDHVVPVSKGGANTAANVQPLCGPCNSSKATKTTDYRPAAAAV